MQDGTDWAGSRFLSAAAQAAWPGLETLPHARRDDIERTRDLTGVGEVRACTTDRREGWKGHQIGNEKKLSQKWERGAMWHVP